MTPIIVPTISAGVNLLLSELPLFVSVVLEAVGGEIAELMLEEEGTEDVKLVGGTEDSNGLMVEDMVDDVVENKVAVVSEEALVMVGFDSIKLLTIRQLCFYISSNCL